MSKFQKFRFVGSVALLVMLVLGGLLYSADWSSNDALAGASVSGDSHLPDRALITVNGSSKVSYIVYFSPGAKTNPGANTPVASGAVCGASAAGVYHYAEVRLVGTMSGTAPTLSVTLQNSIDNQLTWNTVKTFSQINATTVPAVQTQVASDTQGSSFWNGTSVATIPAAVYGDCWRVAYTYGGTGAGASFSVVGVEK